MGTFWILQLEYLIRISGAGVCGALIGYERKNRLKEAGVRTHFIVALASALMMIISKYGFMDVVNFMSIDPSRIAASIVSGIGFLGAGMIFVRKQAIKGLTTAAGIWATAGVGMAMGAGMYVLGVLSTIFIIIVQVLTHKNFKWIKVPVTEQIFIQMKDSPDALKYLREKFEQNNISIINIKAQKTTEGFLNIEAYIKLPSNYNLEKLIEVFEENKDIVMLEY